jgi:Glu-tRNA(Gln) amidotransferase subunit E-like FAD-binding protein
MKMYDRAVAQADRIEAETLRELERMYPEAVSPLIKKHKKTLDKLDKLMQSGATGRARAVMRRSGLLKDLAVAIAGAGSDAVSLIRGEIKGIKEAVKLESQD